MAASLGVLARVSEMGWCEAIFGLTSGSRFEALRKAWSKSIQVGSRPGPTTSVSEPPRREIAKAPCRISHGLDQRHRSGTICLDCFSGLTTGCDCRTRKRRYGGKPEMDKVVVPCSLSSGRDEVGPPGESDA
ncbi:hypothetical protein DPV78_010803 [Talaromyces pinophilus]|nr:hypothetical protein DPV78_010803 [Talaromyces pinophilus]